MNTTTMIPSDVAFARAIREAVEGPYKQRIAELEKDVEHKDAVILQDARRYTARIAELEAECDRLSEKLAEGACEDPSEELIAAVLNDEFERESDGFLTDLCLLIRGRAYFQAEERTKMLAELSASQRMYSDCVNAMVRIAEEKKSLTAFKEYVHLRLDKAGVPANPEPPVHALEGCRVGDRLDWLERGVPSLRAERNSLCEQLTQLEAALHSSSQDAETYRQCMASSAARITELEAERDAATKQWHDEEARHDQTRKERDRAIRALTRAGYTDNGGQEWRPPVVPHVKRKPLLVWECTEEEAAQDLHAAECDVTAGFVASAMVYLASRARVMVPENVPTAEQLWHEWMYKGVNAQTAIHYAYDRLAPYFRQPASVDPAPPVSTGIATAETLEQLAEMLDEEWQRKYGLPSFRAYAGYATEFILRAAKPVIDIKHGVIWRCGKSELHHENLDALNSRIRFTVAPPAECEDCKKLDAEIAEAERRIHAARKALEGEG